MVPSAFGSEAIKELTGNIEKKLVNIYDEMPSGLTGAEEREIRSLRFSGCDDIKLYISEYEDIKRRRKRWKLASHAYNKSGFEQLDDENNISEAMILGLRMDAGVDKSEFEREFGCLPHDVFYEEIEKVKAEGLLEEDEKCLRLTERGVDLANYVMRRFM